MKISRQLIIGTVLLAASGLLAACSDDSKTSTPLQTKAQTESLQAETPVIFETASFTIENMTCASCPITVRKAMVRVPGVQSVAIDYDSKIAVVEYDPALASPAQIAAASTDVGYPATQIES
jgi:periplasmic mercuric ion binding protein